MTIIDVGACIGTQPEDDQDLSAAALLAEMARAGVDEALCSHFAAIRYDGPTGNGELLEICRREPRLKPIAVVNPGPFLGVVEEIRACAAQGFVGFRFAPGRQHWSLEAEPFAVALRAVAETGLPLTVEVAATGEATRVAQLTQGLGVPVILAGIGYSTLGEAIALLQRHPHLYLEACRLVTPGIVKLLVEAVGAQRLLFASGAPAWEMIPTLSLIRAAAIGEEEKALILGGNARRLFLRADRSQQDPSGLRVQPRQKMQPANEVQLVVDVHQHCGPFPFPGRWGGLEENLRWNALRGVDLAIVSSARAVVQDMAEGNAELAEALQGRRGVYGYITLNPTVRQQALGELARYGDDPRFVGAKVHTNYSGCGMGDPRLAALFGPLEEWGKPLLVHTWGVAEVRALAELAQQHPRLPIIMAHAGGDAWRWAIEAAAERPNLYLDFCGSTPYREAIPRGLARLGAERIVFGSDATLLDPLVMRSRYDATPMTEAERALIMGGNALRLFHLATP